MVDESDALEQLRLAWEAARDGETAQNYGLSLEAAGRVDEAAEIYAQAAQTYLSGYYNLAWLERQRGNPEEAMRLLELYLSEDNEPDDFTPHVEAVLGHWRWHIFNRLDAEPLLRRGQDHYQDARADLADLLKATGRLDEAAAVLTKGVSAGEVSSFLPLANIREEEGDLDEAQRLLRLGFALGDAHSAYNLYLILDELGRIGEAQEWLQLAAQAGDQVAVKRIAESSQTGE